MLNQLQQLIQWGRFGQECIEARFPRSLAHFPFAIPCDGNEQGFLSFPLSDLAGHLIPVHPRKADVTQHHFGRSLLEAFQPFQSVESRLHIKFEEGQ